MDNNNNLYSEDDEISLADTHKSQVTFSRNIIKILGIRRASLGIGAINPNFNTRYI